MTATKYTFKDDKFNLKGFSERLERFLLVEHNFVEGSLVVSLNAPFGAGKSMFLQMWKDDLETRRGNDASLPQVILLNAWESDYCGDPLLSIVTALLDALESSKDKDHQKSGLKLREAAKDVAWFTTGMANNLVSHWTGLNPIDAGEFAEGKRKSKKPIISDFISLYEERTKALGNLKSSLETSFNGEAPKAFVFVDELDRCRPDFAITYLETIKHIFDIRGLVFILAVDYPHLASSAKALFGMDLNFHEYYRKFVQRTVTFPKQAQDNLSNLIGFYIKKYLEREGTRLSLMKIDEGLLAQSTELGTALNMTPRQIQEAFRIIGHVVSGDQKNRGQLYWCIGCGTVLMAFLKIARPELYQSIGSGDASYTEVGQFLKNHISHRYAFWWFEIFATGYEQNDEQKSLPVIEKALRELGYLAKGDTFNSHALLGHFYSGWGNTTESRIRQIYYKIENAVTF